MISNFPSRPLRNRGGYKSFEFIPYFYIAQFPPIIGHTVKRDEIVLQDGNVWYQGYATSETLSFNDEPEKTGNGTLFNLKVGGSVPGDSAALTELMYDMEQLHFVVRLTDTRGKVRIIGSPTYPLEFKAVFSSGDQRSSAKGFNFQFYGSSLHRALESIA